MTYTLTITEKNRFLHAVVTGQNTPENVAHYLQDVLRECISRNFSRVLIEERLEGPRLGTLDVFEIASGGVGLARGKLHAIAYVDVNAAGDLMRFAGQVATNRGLSVGIFKTVADAEEWLTRSDQAASDSAGAQMQSGNSETATQSKPKG